MDEVGKYSAEVTVAYAGTFILLGGIVWQSYWASRRARRALMEAELRKDDA